MSDLFPFFSLEVIQDGLREPDSFLLRMESFFASPAIELADGVQISGELLRALHSVLYPDAAFLKTHPEALFTCLYSSLHSENSWSAILSHWEKQSKTPWLRATIQHTQPPQKKFSFAFDLSTPLLFSLDSTLLLSPSGRRWKIPSLELLPEQGTSPRSGTDKTCFSEDGKYCIEDGCDYMGMTDLNYFSQVFESDTGQYVYMEDNYGTGLQKIDSCPPRAKSGGEEWLRKQGGLFSEAENLWLPPRFSPATTSPDKRWVAAISKRALQLFEIVRP